MTPNDPPLPRASRVRIEEGLAVISPSHRFVALVAQDCLTPCWAAFPRFPVQIPEARWAARGAILEWQEAIEAPDPLLLWLAALRRLSARHHALCAQFAGRLLWREQSSDFGYWQGYFSANQHGREPVAGLSPDRLEALMRAYRTEVAAERKAARERIALAGQSDLDDWDLWLHSQYAWSLQGDDRFDDGDLALAMRALDGTARFAQFLRDHVPSLSAAEQAALTGAMRAYWADLWSDQPEAGPVPPETAADAERIQSVAQMSRQASEAAERLAVSS